MQRQETSAVLPHVLAALRQARSTTDAGTTVLDRLASAGVLSAQVQSLQSDLGVELPVVPPEWTPDFSRWSKEQAVRHRCVLMRAGPRAWLLAADPWDELVVQRVARAAGVQPVPVPATAAQLQAALSLGEAAAPPAGDGDSASGPVVAFVDAVLDAGFRSGASDVHFETDRGGVTAKHRLDGVMQEFSRLEGRVQAEEVISRIKVLAQLDITERRLPQDGRFRLALGDGAVDLRVSIMPSVHGEDAVLRILDKSRLRGGTGPVSLDVLGFDSADAGTIRGLAAAPSGLLLVTGPTGSGKTTTVYAALSEINSGLEKIITIEDPVEYELPGVLQIPVNERKGLTFALGLRSILRHDPDRILVGEIRDAETAEIAVQSALTGHLVFTTVHANSVSDVIGRFRHFGLDMFGFMSSLNGMVVQRLVRRVCPSCAAQRAPTAAEAQWLAKAGEAEAAPVRSAGACSECHESGYRGRFVISEVHVVDDEFRDLVTGGAPLSAIKDHAVRRGVVALQVQAARAVAKGWTTIEEVRRVVGSA